MKVTISNWTWKWTLMTASTSPVVSALRNAVSPSKSSVLTSFSNVRRAEDS